MADSDRTRLVNEYHAALQAYSRAVGELQGISGAQFGEAYRRAEAARLACEACRMALEEHERTAADRAS
jgi:hypothetical protein